MVKKTFVSSQKCVKIWINRSLTQNVIHLPYYVNILIKYLI